MTTPHVHISAVQTFINAIGVLIVLAVLHVIARKFEGHPAADAILNVFA